MLSGGFYITRKRVRDKFNVTLGRAVSNDRFCYVVSDTDKTFNFIAAMVYTQMFNVLCDKALKNGDAFHPQYKYLADADPKNTFDVAKFLKRRLRVRPEDVFGV